MSPRVDAETDDGHEGRWILADLPISRPDTINEDLRLSSSARKALEQFGTFPESGNSGAAGRRKDGRWAWGRLANDEDLHRSDIRKALAHCGTVLDYLPDALVLQAAGRRRDGRWKRDTVDTLGSQNSSNVRFVMAQCGTVLDYLPEVATAVRDGEVRPVVA